MTRRFPAFALAALLFLGLGGLAHAGGGTVLAIDGADIYVDLGTRDGVGPNSQLTLLHVIVARDPVTGKVLRDRFPLGVLTVVKSGERVSLAHAPDELRQRVRVGDEVALASRPRAFADPWKDTIDERRVGRDEAARARVAAERPEEARAARRKEALERADAAIAAATAATAVWQRTLGKAPAERIAIWEDYLAATPGTPYATAVKLEIQSLRDQIAAEAQVAEQVMDPHSRRAELRANRLAVLDRGLDLGAPLVVRAPTRVYEGAPVELALTIVKPGSFEKAWLYYRHRKQDSFRRVELVSDGDFYLRGTIPSSEVRPPGIEYFVETLPAGEGERTPEPALGSQERPQRIAVERAVEEKAPDIKDRSRVTLFVDYVDFDGGLGRGFDQYLHAEIDFMYRFYRPIYAVRVGFGTIGGMGGPKDWIDMFPDTCTDPSGIYLCRRVTYSFAYTEFEYRFSPSIALMLRPQFGTGTTDSRPVTDTGRCNTDDIAECEFFSGFGLRALLRIGNERATNLTLAMGVTANVGTVFEAAYTWSVIPQFPVKLSAQVTDQPVPEDFGVRMIADVGWRSVSWVYPSLRLAYQARDVDHAGLSGGVAVNFDW